MCNCTRILYLYEIMHNDDHGSSLNIFFEYIITCVDWAHYYSRSYYIQYISTVVSNPVHEHNHTRLLCDYK